MTTSIVQSSSDPLQFTITTDRHMVDLGGELTVTVGSDVVPQSYNMDPAVLNDVTITDSTGHEWTKVSDDHAVPTSTIVIQY